ncbi:MAG TPA: formate--tetrahydrofolate ligase, partial [Planococcus sp. (in: firmicutes)]|nr:formate--tetrahydrofolate ligase [Planococcus sp. (in: firmicutes)]
MAFTDLAIATKAKILPIQKIAEKVGISPDALELYGKFKAKIDVNALPAATNLGK